MSGLDELSTSFSEDLYGITNLIIYDIRNDSFQRDITAMNIVTGYQKSGVVDKTAVFNLFRALITL